MLFIFIFWYTWCMEFTSVRPLSKIIIIWWPFMINVEGNLMLTGKGSNSISQRHLMITASSINVPAKDQLWLVPTLHQKYHFPHQHHEYVYGYNCIGNDRKISIIGYLVIVCCFRISKFAPHSQIPLPEIPLLIFTFSIWQSTLSLSSENKRI